MSAFEDIISVANCNAFDPDIQEVQKNAIY